VLTEPILQNILNFNYAATNIRKRKEAKNHSLALLKKQIHPQ